MQTFLKEINNSSSPYFLSLHTDNLCLLGLFIFRVQSSTIQSLGSKFNAVTMYSRIFIVLLFYYLYASAELERYPRSFLLKKLFKFGNDDHCEQQNYGGYNNQQPGYQEPHNSNYNNYNQPENEGLFGNNFFRGFNFRGLHRGFHNHHPFGYDSDYSYPNQRYNSENVYNNYDQPPPSYSPPSPNYYENDHDDYNQDKPSYQPPPPSYYENDNQDKPSYQPPSDSYEVDKTEYKTDSKSSYSPSSSYEDDKSDYKEDSKTSYQPSSGSYSSDKSDYKEDSSYGSDYKEDSGKSSYQPSSNYHESDDSYGTDYNKKKEYSDDYSKQSYGSQAQYYSPPPMTVIYQQYYVPAPIYPIIREVPCGHCQSCSAAPYHNSAPYYNSAPNYNANYNGATSNYNGGEASSYSTGGASSYSVEGDSTYSAGGDSSYSAGGASNYNSGASYNGYDSEQTPTTYNSYPASNYVEPKIEVEPSALYDGPSYDKPSGMNDNYGHGQAPPVSYNVNVDFYTY